MQSGVSQGSVLERQRTKYIRTISQLTQKRPQRTMYGLMNNFEAIFTRCGKMWFKLWKVNGTKSDRVLFTLNKVVNLPNKLN